MSFTICQGFYDMLILKRKNGKSQKGGNVSSCQTAVYSGSCIIF